MGRKSDQAKYVRLELRYERERPGPVFAELEEEAKARNMPLIDHIRDLLTHRHNARHGKPYIEALWVPIVGHAPAEAAPEPAPSEDPPQPKGGRAAAQAWLPKKRS